MLETELESLLEDCEYAIVYKPLKDEVDFKKIHILKDALKRIERTKNKIVLSQSKNKDPFEQAKQIIKTVGKSKTFLLIPGQQFDIDGTRKGRGVGWYDRFLSKVPKDWLKIGIANHKQFSTEKLQRQEWDEPMDWVIICGEDNSRYIIIR
jgi:5,10-methenyltetrahydrofolate synthetase